MEQCSIHEEGRKRADLHKWIESEKAGYDLGEDALRQWIREHWCGYLRASLLEHILGIRYWTEIDRGDFGLLNQCFQDQPVLVDRILDRIRAGQENLDILLWAIDWGIGIEPVHAILEALDINSRRLAPRFDR